MADDLFRIASLSSKNSFENSSRFNPAKQAIRVFDDTPSKSRIASSSSAKGYLPVFDLVPRYDDDIFEGVPGTKSATAGTVYDDLFGDVEVVKSTAAPHLVGRPSSDTDSTVRRANPTDVSSSVSRDGLSDSNSFQSSRSRWGRPNTQYARWSQQPSLAGSNDFLRKPAKMDCPDDLFVDPVSPGNHQARESTVLDSLDPFNMKYHTGGKNVPVVSIVSEETSRAKENTASIGSCQSTTMSMSSHSKPSHNSYVRKLENGNLTSSETPSKIGALEVRTVRQHIHRNGPTAGAFSTPVTPSTWKKSQYSANIDSRYSNSPVKSNEFLPGKLTPSTQFNVEHISESIRHIEPRGFEEVWLTIDDVRLVTHPTSAPPPSRSPPTFGLNKKEMTQRRKSNQSKGFASKLLEGEERFPNAKVGSDSTLGHQAAKTPVSGFPLFQEKGIKLSKAQLESTNYGFVVRPEEQRVASVATASELDMKEAIKRAEALLKLGKDLEEKELSAKAAKEAEKEEKENVAADAQRVGKKEPNHTDARESEVDQQGSWRHRDHERTKNRLAFESANQEAREKAGVKAPSETRERAEKAAVQRITAEVRERAAAEAREKVAAKIKTVTEARLKAAAGARERAAAEPRERAAMEARERAVAEARKKSAAEARERVTAEAREKAAAEARKQEAAEAREKAAEEAREKERAAADARERERAAAEARERAATEASEKEAIEAGEKAARELMEKLAVEAREKAAAEGKEKLVAEEKARMAAEARERIAAEARERAAAGRAAAQARVISERVAVQKAIDEVRERAAEKAKAEARQRDAEKAMAEAHIRAESAQKLRPATLDPMNASYPSKIFQKEEDRSSACGSSAVKMSPTIIPDDWMASFVASPTTEFQEIRGELSDRRQVSSERHQRTEERMAKALADKNQRDFEVLRQEAEKQRAAEVLDAEIRRWAVGKEGNLRALLSTLHYVLWPGCGWQPVSVSDLVTAAAVKKIYRKATLCIHPDKVQQKGSSVQQKYIAEKVFDLLKEAWNKFSSGELF